MRKGAIATIGTFDGLHRGHRMVLDLLLSTAGRRELKPMVFTFERHPLELIAPQRVPPRLMDFDRKQQMLFDMGIEVVKLNFNQQMRSMTSYDFMKLLRDDYNVEVIVTGYDNKFGHDRQSTFDDYCLSGQKLGIEVIKADISPDVSSSILRRIIAQGKVEQAAELLGSRYDIEGCVVHGRHLGTTIGFPTANIQPTDPHRLVPGEGVYAALIKLPDASLHRAMVNIGRCPTVSDNCRNRTIEVNIFNFNGDIYGQLVNLQFVAFIRNEQKFDSIETLRRRLQQDKADVDKLLDANHLL